MDDVRHDEVGRLGYLLLAGLTLSSGGCLALAAGTAAGGAGYAYYRGNYVREVPATSEITWAATASVLNQLGMPQVAQEKTAAGGWIESRSGTGDKVKILLDPVAPKIPTDGPRTRVAVRVGTFGDEEVSVRLLDQISRNLTPTNVTLEPPVATSSPPPPEGNLRPVPVVNR